MTGRISTREPMKMNLPNGTTVVEIAIPNRLYKAIHDIEEHLTASFAISYSNRAYGNYEVWRYDDEVIKEHILAGLDQANLRKAPTLIPDYETRNTMLVGIYFDIRNSDVVRHVSCNINVDLLIRNAIFRYVCDSKGSEYAMEALYEWDYHAYNITKHGTCLEDIEKAFEQIEYRRIYDNGIVDLGEDYYSYHYNEEEDDQDYSIITVVIEVGSGFNSKTYTELGIYKPIIGISKDLNEARIRYKKAEYEMENAEEDMDALLDDLVYSGYSEPYDIARSKIEEECEEEDDYAECE